MRYRAEVDRAEPWRDVAAMLFFAVAVPLAGAWWCLRQELLACSDAGGDGPGGTIFLCLMVVGYPVLVAVPWAVIQLVRGLRATGEQRLRRLGTAGALALGVTLTIGSLVAVNGIASERYWQQVERTVARADGLVAAIKRYETDHDQPPDALTDLVPAYLATVPGTGWPAYPTFRYERLETNAEDSSRWELSIRMGFGFLDWSRCVYRPTGVYPEARLWDQRWIGGWCYGKDD